MINAINYSIEDGENGILILFPAVPDSLPNKEFYIVDFEIGTTLPSLSPPTITFTPSSPSYVIYGNKNFQPIVNLTIKAKHNFQTQSIIRAVVKSPNNQILYSDYINIICSPDSVVKLQGSLLNSDTSEGSSNNNSVLRIQNVALIGSLFIGMSVQGPGIPDNDNVTIKAFVDGVSSDIELSKNLNIGTEIFSGEYTFTANAFCASPAQLERRGFENNYIIIDKNNNWTLSYNDRIVLKFIPENTNDDIKILLPIKNLDSLLSEKPNNIPSTASINLGGRVSNDTVCLSSIS